MNNFKLLFLSVLTISVLSCSKDDDKELSVDEMILGTWYPAAEYQPCYENDPAYERKGMGVAYYEYDNSKEADECVLSSYLTFKEKGKATVRAYDFFDIVITDENGSRIGEECVLLDPVDAAWIVSGNTLMITMDEEITEHKIEEITETTLKLIYESDCTSEQHHTEYRKK